MICGVQRILNGNRTTPNQTSPAELLFGNAIILDRGLFQRQPNQDFIKSMKKAELLQRAKYENYMSNATQTEPSFLQDLG